MIYATSFQAVHARRLDIQDEQAADMVFAIEMTELASLQSDCAFSLWSDTTLLGCGGVVPCWPGRATAWALVSMHAGKHMVAMTRP